MQIFINALLDILKILSSEAEDQLLYLQTIGGGSIDELALEFEELMLVAPSKLSSGEITKKQFSSIEFLNIKLDGLSENDKIENWTESALAKSDEWEEIRKLASGCIRQFD